MKKLMIAASALSLMFAFSSCTTTNATPSCCGKGGECCKSTACAKCGKTGCTKCGKTACAKCGKAGCTSCKK